MMMLVNARDLYVETHGPLDAPLVVLLHHGLGSVSAWKDQITALVEAGWRVAVYDRWGYGRSDPRPALDVPHFKNDLADLQAILNNLDAGEVALVGHSDGGTIALYYAAQNPQRVACLVTVAAHIYLESKMEPSVEGIRRTFENDERFRVAFRRVHGQKAESVFWNWYQAWTESTNRSWDMRPLLLQIDCPALVVQGVEDEHATPRHAEDIAAAIPGAELWLLPGVGHMLPQDAAETFNPRLVSFLQSYQPGQSWRPLS